MSLSSKVENKVFHKRAQPSHVLTIAYVSKDEKTWFWINVKIDDIDWIQVSKDEHSFFEGFIGKTPYLIPLRHLKLFDLSGSFYSLKGLRSKKDNVVDYSWDVHVRRSSTIRISCCEGDAPSIKVIYLSTKDGKPVEMTFSDLINTKTEIQKLQLLLQSC
jgi:hypothetical protein